MLIGILVVGYCLVWVFAPTRIVELIAALNGRRYSARTVRLSGLAFGLTMIVVLFLEYTGGL